jgi:hypothetical protein
MDGVAGVSDEDHTWAMVLIAIVVVCGVAALWLAARHHRATWGEARGQEPGVKPMPESKAWLGQGRG